MKLISRLLLRHAALIPVIGITTTFLLLVGVNWVADPASGHSLEVSRRQREAAAAREQQVLVARFGDAASPVHPVTFARGKAYFDQSCAVCHGRDAHGVAALGGKDLVASPFVTEKADADLAAFIAEGREPTDPASTTQMLMPPRGGNPDLGDAAIADIVSYLRGLQDPRRRPVGPLPRVAIDVEPEEVVTTEAAVAAAPTATDAAAPALAASDAAAPAPAAAVEQVALDPEAVKRGKRGYLSCLACHGRDGKGVKGVGKDLVNSPFVTGTPDADLVAFIKVGRGPSDPANTTGLAMPPKGGNPALKDEQIKDIVTYIRSLHQAAAAKADAAN